MLSPVSSLPIATTTTTAVRDTPAAVQTLAAVTTAVDAAVALSIAANSEVAGKLNMLLIGARERMIDSLFAVVDAVSQSLNMQQQAGETNVDFAARLVSAISNLDPKQAAALQQQLGAQVQSAPLALVARALQNPAGSEAAQVVAYLEVVRYKEKDLATKAVVASYGQNGADELLPAKAAVAPAAVQGDAVRQDPATAQTRQPAASQPAAQGMPAPASLTEEPPVAVSALPQTATSEPKTTEQGTLPAANLPGHQEETAQNPTKVAGGPPVQTPATPTTASSPSQTAPLVSQPVVPAPAPTTSGQQNTPSTPVANQTAQDLPAAAESTAAPVPTGGSSSNPQAPQAAVLQGTPSSPAASAVPAGGAQGNPVASSLPSPTQAIQSQIPTDVQTVLKVVVAQLASTAGVELLQTMAEVAPVAEKVVAQALVADMLDSAEIGTLPSPEDDAPVPRLAMPQATGSSAQSPAVVDNPAELPASVAALSRLLGETAPAVSTMAQPLPLQAQLPLGVPFAVGQYLPAEDVVDENEALRIDRVDAVEDEEEERSPGGRRRGAGDEAADEQDEAGDAEPETPASADAEVRPLALPRPAPVEPVREPAFNLYQRMGGWD